MTELSVNKKAYLQEVAFTYNYVNAHNTEYISMKCDKEIKHKFRSNVAVYSFFSINLFISSALKQRM